MSGSVIDRSWSDDPPTEPGWYWWRASNENQPYAKPVRLIGGELKVQWATGWELVGSIGGDWHGPIEVPSNQ